MFQLYLLTVLTTILSGAALASGFLSERFERFSEYTEFMANTVYRVILGSLSILIGIINLFKTYEGDIGVLGELFPSLAGLATGVLLLVEFVNARRGEEDESKAAEIAGKVGSFSGPYLTVVGVAAVVIGVLHAILPKLPLL